MILSIFRMSALMLCTRYALGLNDFYFMYRFGQQSINRLWHSHSRTSTRWAHTLDTVMVSPYVYMYIHIVLIVYSCTINYCFTEFIINFVIFVTQTSPSSL